MAAPDPIDFVGLVQGDRRQAIADARTQLLQSREDQAYGANQAAGRYLAGGDYQGATGALAASGQLEPALQLRQAGQQQVAYDRQQAQIAAQKQQATSYQNRDYAGAGAAAAGVGDVAGVTGAQDAGAKSVQAQHAFMSRALPVFEAASKQPGGLEHALDTLQPDLTAIGMTPEQFDKQRQFAATNPQAYVESVRNALIPDYKVEKVGDNLVSYDAAHPNATTPKILYQAPVKLGQTDRLVGPAPDGGAVGAGGQQPTANGAAPTPVAVRPPPVDYRPIVAQIAGDPQAQLARLVGAPVTVTSGYRTQAQNAALPGSSSTSEHLTGSAWDFKPQGMTNQQAVQRLVASGVPFDQIIDEGSHVHIGFGPKSRGVVMASNPDGSGMRVVGGGASFAPPPGQVAPQQQAPNPAGYQTLVGPGAPQFRPATAAELKANPGYASGQMNTATGEFHGGAKTSEIEDMAPLDAPTAKYLAQQYTSGDKSVLAGLGYGKGGSQRRAQVLKIAQQMDTSLGNDGADAVLRRSDLKANSAALGKGAEQLRNVQSYEGNMTDNLTRAMAIIDRVAGNNPPLLNRPIREIQAQLGSTDVVALRTALGIVANEAAKVNSGAMGNQGSSDSARHEAQNLLNPDMSAAQLRAAAAVIIPDAHSRVANIKKQQEALRSQIKGGPATVTGPASTGGARPSLSQIFGQ